MGHRWNGFDWFAQMSLFIYRVYQNIASGWCRYYRCVLLTSFVWETANTTNKSFFKQKYPRFSPFIKSFRYICNIVPLLQRWCGMTLTKRCYWNYLHLSQILARFEYGTKMVAIAPHHLVYAYPNRFEYYHFGVGYCLIRTRGNARSQREWIRQI